MNYYGANQSTLSRREVAHSEFEKAFVKLRQGSADLIIVSDLLFTSQTM